jgi:hypothetical protein
MQRDETNICDIIHHNIRDFEVPLTVHIERSVVRIRFVVAKKTKLLDNTGTNIFESKLPSERLFKIFDRTALIAHGAMSRLPGCICQSTGAARHHS